MVNKMLINAECMQIGVEKIFFFAGLSVSAAIILKVFSNSAWLKIVHCYYIERGES